MQSSNQSSAEAAETRCVCGQTTTRDPEVILNPEYSFSGWFFLAFGVTVTPKRIVYQCRHCGRKFAATTDTVELERHV